MLNASMTKKDYSSFFCGFLLIAIFWGCAFQLKAEVFKPIQIILPGNIQGRSAELSRDLKVAPGLCWRIPETIEGLKRNRSNHVMVFATGNDSDIFSPLSFLSSGKLERGLINYIKPECAALSPNDIEIFGKSLLDSDIKSRIWTNLEAENNHYLFKPFLSQPAEHRKIFFFNFIGARRCTKLPLDNWGQFTIDNPARSLRRLSPEMSEKDYSISLAYLDKHETEELASQLKKLPGNHFLIHVPQTGELTFYPVIYGEHDENLCKMALMPGHSFLPVLNIFSSNFAKPRMTLRMLPLEKTTAKIAEAIFKQEFAPFTEPMKATRKVVTTNHQASTSAFTFAKHIHADIIRKSARCDISFVINPQMRHLNDNVIAEGHILTAIDNERIRKVRLTGQELLEFFELIFSARGIDQVAFSGCEASYLGGRVVSIKINGQPAESKRSYLLATTESSLNDLLIASFLRNKNLESYDGLTLWQVWRNELKSLKISAGTISK